MMNTNEMIKSEWFNTSNTAGRKFEPASTNDMAKDKNLFENYIVQKMYNYDELSNFASPETRLK